MARFIFFTCCALMCHLSFAQSDDENTSDQLIFFAKKLPEYRAWLKLNGLSEYLTADTVEQSGNNYILKLHCFSKLRWQQLSSGSDSLLPFTSFSEQLFNRAAFLADLDPHFIKIIVGCKDADIIISQVNNSITSGIYEKKGDAEPVVVKTLFPSSYDCECFAENIAHKNTGDDSLLRLISDKMEGYFKPYSTYFQQCKVDKYPMQEGMNIRVSNITKLVLSTGYFEHISLDMKLSSIGGQLQLVCLVQLKYASGIIWSPLDERYSDMEAQYPTECREFRMRLQSKIHEILTSL